MNFMNSAPATGVRSSVEAGQQKEQYLAEAKKFFKIWRKLTIDWAKEFPDELKGKEELDTVGESLPWVTITRPGCTLIGGGTVAQRGLQARLGFTGGVSVWNGTLGSLPGNERLPF